jgi:UDP:flavonoid glycosyltransferase YjiC (YdhE family)
MRVMLTSWAWPAHFLPLVPLGLALRTAGHEVVVAGQPVLENTIRNSGLTAVTVGKDLDSAEIVRFQMQLLPDDQVGFHERTRTSEGAKTLGMFATFADAMVDDLIEFAGAWEPDLILYEATCYAGALSAQALGVTAVRHLLGLDFTYAVRQFGDEALGPLCTRLGLDGLDIMSAPAVDPCPPSLQLERDISPMAMRYLPSNGSGMLPGWVLEPPSRPRVCLTWDTSLAKLGTHLFIAGDLLRILGELDIEVVVAITREQRELLGEVPGNARVLESVPLNLILPTCELLVQQGGQGTTLTAATLGVPQLIIPQLPEQTFTARQTVATGAARMLLREDLGRESLIETVRDMLRDTGLRDAAVAIRKENAERPLPVDLVPALEDLAR